MPLAEKHIVDGQPDRNSTIKIRRPVAEDGVAVWTLIQSTSALDDNSLYCNLLQCTHFASTSAIAMRDDQVVGWVSGYIPPENADTLFIWQIGIADEARGSGLAKRLILNVLARPSSRHVRFVACTITQDNSPSWALFSSLARCLSASMSQQDHFCRDDHFGGTHESERAVTIGPFPAGKAAQALVYPHQTK
ncbi:diaminobutyrate acetyltransferase [Agrobacterium sp.]|uniref:diaminobutyrate acetyltransferase n=1 Tax=Agrobacterium sp. TaxID=361 RepID=UPI0028AD3167|nr:diaminobutyrate acetyltransferase [Agrobacterium sp.]